MRELHAPGKETEGNFLIERMRKLLEIELNLRSVSFLNSYNNNPSGEVGMRVEPDGTINDNDQSGLFKDNLLIIIHSFFKKVRGYVDTGNEFDSIKTIIDNVLSDKDEKKVQNLIKRLCSTDIARLIIGDVSASEIEENLGEYARNAHSFSSLGLKYVLFENNNRDIVNVHLESIFLENPFKLRGIILQEFRALAGFLIDQISHQEISGYAEVCLDSWIVYENEKIFSSAGFEIEPSDIKRYFNDQYSSKKATMSVSDFIKNFATKN